METYIIKRERMTVDLLLFQAYGPEGQDLVETTLDLNPGLADKGPVIPLGTSVTIPDRPVANPFVVRPVVSLF